jgi:hypothetical protein
MTAEKALRLLRTMEFKSLSKNKFMLRKIPRKIVVYEFKFG